MSRRYYNLPPFSTLSAFEAAARHLSFKNAASELGVTPGAVSHQVKALERELGVSLFERRHRGVELTEHGELLRETVAASYGRISHRLKMLRDQSASAGVTIGSTSAVASLWLSPLITRFWRAHPTISVNQLVQDKPFTNADELDLFIRYGPDPLHRFEQFPLYQDVLVPVCTAEIADALTGVDLPTLASQRLIHLHAESANWPSWRDWFTKLGYRGEVGSGMRVNNYAIALQAARDGAGVALGWRRLIRTMLTQNELCVLEGHELPAPHRFHIVSRPEEDLTEGATLLRDWIIREAQAG